jgi:TRAP-type C4-dicarboxylate transport system permease small subunit
MAQQVQQLSRFKSIVLKISKGGVVVSCIMLAVMMLISTADVFGRYFFLHPIDGTWEIVSMAFVVCGSFAIGYTQFIKGHIAINIFSDRLSPKARNILFIFSYLVCLVASALITWQTWLRMVVYFHKTLGGETVTLGMPIWPFMLILAMGFFWVAVIFIIDIYDCFREVLKR